MAFDMTFSPLRSWSDVHGDQFVCPYHHSRCLMCRCGHWEHAHEGGTLCAECPCDAVRRPDRTKEPV